MAGRVWIHWIFDALLAGTLTGTRIAEEYSYVWGELFYPLFERAIRDVDAAGDLFATLSAADAPAAAAAAAAAAPVAAAVAAPATATPAAAAADK